MDWEAAAEQWRLLCAGLQCHSGKCFYFAFPWLFSLGRGEKFLICQVARDWAVTAAHCLVDRQPSEMILQFGNEFTVDADNIAVNATFRWEDRQFHFCPGSPRFFSIRNTMGRLAGLTTLLWSNSRLQLIQDFTGLPAFLPRMQTTLAKWVGCMVRCDLLG